MANVYLIHFDDKLAHAQHYLGFAEIPVRRRLQRHLDGRGSRLIRAVVNAGITVRLGRVWTGPDVTRDFERSLKNRRNARKLCPICRGEHDGLDPKEY